MQYLYLIVFEMYEVKDAGVTKFPLRHDNDVEPMTTISEFAVLITIECLHLTSNVSICMQIRPFYSVLYDLADLDCIFSRKRVPSGC